MSECQIMSDLRTQTEVLWSPQLNTSELFWRTNTFGRWFQCCGRSAYVLKTTLVQLIAAHRVNIGVGVVNPAPGMLLSFNINPNQAHLNQESSPSRAGLENPELQFHFPYQ